MGYKLTGTNYDGSPIKQPIWESMTPEERVAYAAKASVISAKSRDLVEVQADGSLTGLMDGKPIARKGGKSPGWARVSEQ